MNKFLDILAKGILATILIAIIGLLGYAMYQQPQVILPMVGGGALIALILWAVSRVLQDYES